MTPLLLSHFGIVTSLGAGEAETVARLRSGRGGLKPCDFETATLPTYIGAVERIEDRPIDPPLAAFDCRNNRLVRMALEQDGFKQAVSEARARYGAGRIGVFAGTSTAGILQTELAFRQRDPETGELPDGFQYRGSHSVFSVADFVQRELRLTGPALSVSAACASTAKAFGNAARMIELGICDAAVVGGADSLCLTTLYGFHSLQLTGERPCQPFDLMRGGISIGEAAGFALVERTEGRKGIALLGIGESGDAYHMSSPHPEGLGAKRAMAGALATSGLTPGAIDYINLHGTATRVGDAAEDNAVWSLFEDSVPCNSTKGLTGHTLGAAGIVEAIISTLCISHGFIPPSPTTRQLDPDLRSRYTVSGGDAALTHVMSNSFGFGGSNCSLVFGRLS
jgi:3-oxoacyl-[acyl-carrier-protein] synthase-1